MQAFRPSWAGMDVYFRKADIDPFLQSRFSEDAFCIFHNRVPPGHSNYMSSFQSTHADTADHEEEQVEDFRA